MATVPPARDRDHARGYKISPYAKAVVATLLPLAGTIATWIQAAMSDGTITGNEWTKIGIFLATTVLTGGATFAVPNRGSSEQAATMSVIGPKTTSPPRGGPLR